MASYQVTCITKPHPHSLHEHITHIGNPVARWKMTREEAIRQIDAKISSFYIVDPRNGKISHVGVVREVGRLPYLRTYADGDWNNNLLSLNQCPIG